MQICMTDEYDNFIKTLKEKEAKTVVIRRDYFSEGYIRPRNKSKKYYTEMKFNIHYHDCSAVPLTIRGEARFQEDARMKFKEQVVTLTERIQEAGINISQASDLNFLTRLLLKVDVGMAKA